MVLKALKGIYSTDLSIDLGTANTLVLIDSAGIILELGSCFPLLE